MNQQLVDYIQQQVKNGYNLSAIKDFLIKQGYSQNDVNEAINFVSQQRLLPIINYIQDNLSRGVDQDTIKARLLAMGYQAPDINEALSRSLVKKGVQIPTILIIVLVASVIFGLGLFFLWPKAPQETAGPSIIETGGAGAGETTTPKFETKPTVELKETKEEKPTEYADIVMPKPEVEENVTGAEQPAPEEKPAVTEDMSEFEDIINKASKETNVDNAVNICKGTDNAMYRDACYDQLSKSFDSSALCAKIEDQSLRDSCYMSIVMKKKDYTLCNDIIDASLKGSCESLKDNLPSGNLTFEDLADIGKY